MTALIEFKKLAMLATLLSISGFLPSAAFAQLSDLRLPISLDADSTDYDGKNSMLMFKGLRLSQGNVGIEADEGRASKLDFEDSIWRFSGNVIIDVEGGHIECESADLQFVAHQLLVADIKGGPATFELTRADSEQTTYAEAGKLLYDIKAGTIEFSENAVITEGGNQISSSFLVYNILEQRINANAEDGDRVKIIYTPRDVDETIPEGADDAAVEDDVVEPESDNTEDRPEGDGT
jgi:lipopolysaccharide transport protein LptA